MGSKLTNYMFSEKEQMFADNVGKEISIIGSELKGINLGLYYPEPWTNKGKVEPNGVVVFFPSISGKQNKVYVQNYNQVKIIHENCSPKSEEVLYHFIAWLTTRSKEVTLSAKHEASTICELLNEYCIFQGFYTHEEINGLGEFNFKSLKPMPID